ncbi:AraC family transcriptional regulator ligand-binding domain-containing protein [Thalassotalea sp. PLHSN55]|uniref:AraC family transcriptional regulator n=1 Tax=Thalassotalea sp. PLHSN55 TaxID=3435888 RepID=UPI003F875070
MLDLVRAAALSHFDQAVENFNGDHTYFLHKVGLSKKLLSTPDMYMQYNDFIKLLNITSTELKQPNFGLHLGCMQNIELLGSISYLLKNCKTVGDALINFKRFFHHHLTSADIGLTVENDRVTWSYAINLNTIDSTAQATDLALGLGVNILTTLTSNNANITSLHLQHSSPKNRASFKNYLGIMPNFNSTFNGICFSKKALELPIAAADPTLLNILAAQFNSDNIGYVDEVPQFVENIIRQNIAITPLSIEAVADQMAISVRSLQRHLSSQNTSFRKIVDNVRNKLASQYLIDSTLSLNHISDVLGFSNYSEFSRAFKRWNNTSPKEYRTIHSPRKRFTRLKHM